MYPKLENNQIDKEAVKKLYMESPHTQWVPFAESMGWNPIRSRSDFPVRAWAQEKRNIFLFATSEKIRERLLKIKDKWHEDVLKFFEETPQICDEMVVLIKAKLKTMLMEKERVDTKDINQLFKAIQTMVEVKKESLILKNWSLKEGESYCDEVEIEDMESKGFKFNVIGYENGLSVEDIQKLMDQYLDKPRDAIDA